MYCSLLFWEINQSINHRVDLSWLENISEPAETLTIKVGQGISTQMVEYSGQSDIVRKDLKKHIAANIPAIEYASLEVLSKK